MAPTNQSVPALWQKLPTPTQQYVLALSGNHRVAMLSKELCFTQWRFQDVVTWLRTRRRSPTQLNKALCAAVEKDRMDVCLAILDMEHPRADPQHAKHGAAKVAARLGRVKYLQLFFSHMEKQGRLYLNEGKIAPSTVYAACEGGDIPTLSYALQQWSLVQPEYTEFNLSMFAKWLWWSIEHDQLSSVRCICNLLPYPVEGFEALWDCAIENAIRWGHFEIFMWLTQTVYADGLTSDDMHGLLSQTSRCSGSAHITRYLLQQDVVRDKDWLHEILVDAAKRNYSDMCWLILQEKDRHGSSHNASQALTAALQYEYIHVCNMLRLDQHGPARYDAVGHFPWKSPIVAAATSGLIRVLRALLVRLGGKQWFNVHPHRFYAIHAAERMNNPNTAAFLKQMLEDSSVALPDNPTSEVLASCMRLQPGNVLITPAAHLDEFFAVNPETLVMTCDEVDTWRSQVQEVWTWDWAQRFGLTGRDEDVDDDNSR